MCWQKVCPGATNSGSKSSVSALTLKVLCRPLPIHAGRFRMPWKTAVFVRISGAFCLRIRRLQVQVLSDAPLQQTSKQLHIGNLGRILPPLFGCLNPFALRSAVRSWKPSQVMRLHRFFHHVSASQRNSVSSAGSKGLLLGSASKNHASAIHWRFSRP